MELRPSTFLPTPTGDAAQRLKGGFRTKDEAEKALARTLADAQTGVVLDPGKVTLGEYLEDWLASVSRSLKPTTLELRPRRPRVDHPEDRWLPLDRHSRGAGEAVRNA